MSEKMIILTLLIALTFINLYLFSCSWLPFQNLYPPLSFYFANQINNKYSDHSHYSVSVFAISSVNNLKFIKSVMIHLTPQDVYLFLHGEKIIYHPKQESVGKCQLDFAKAFMVSVDKSYQHPTEICHRKLDYLKKLYTKKIFFKTFDSLQHPETVINLILKSFNKAKGYNKVLNVFSR